MSQLNTFSEEVKSIGGILITKTRELNQALLPKNPLWKAFLNGWKKNKSIGFFNGWEVNGNSPELNESEKNIWLEHYKSLMEVLDSAGQVGIAFLPDKKSGSWFWYYAFGFPTLVDKPRGRIIIGNHCPIETLISLEKQIGQELPPITRAYYRVMGEVIFTGDLNRRNGILGLEPGLFGYVGNPNEKWLGDEDWVPWNHYKPLACVAFFDSPDEIWLGKDTGDQMLLVSHDPGEIQEFADNLSKLITDSLFYVDESRWIVPDPNEAKRLGFDAMQAGKYEEAIELYRIGVEGFRANGENNYRLITQGELIIALKNSGKYSEAKELAITVIKEIESFSKIGLAVQWAFQDAVNSLSEILLSEGKPEEVLEIINEAIKHKELEKDKRWEMTTWLLLALLSIGDKAQFMKEWDKLTSEIYKARKKDEFIEPEFDNIIAEAKKMGWNIEFIPTQ